MTNSKHNDPYHTQEKKDTKLKRKLIIAHTHLEMSLNAVTVLVRLGLVL